jgi:hypothetical protein
MIKGLIFFPVSWQEEIPARKGKLQEITEK